MIGRHPPKPALRRSFGNEGTLDIQPNDRGPSPNMRPNPETFLCRQGGTTAERKGATPKILKGLFIGNHWHARWFATEPFPVA